MGYSREDESSYMLLDGNLETNWYVSSDAKLGEGNGGLMGEPHVGWVEWHTFFSNVPKSVTFTCGKYTGKIPLSVSIFAKNSKDDNWTRIFNDNKFDSHLQAKKGSTRTCNLNNDKAYKYYRIECGDNNKFWSLSLGEVTINY
jgi:hypothetical protein